MPIKPSLHSNISNWIKSQGLGDRALPALRAAGRPGSLGRLLSGDQVKSHFRALIQLDSIN